MLIPKTFAGSDLCLELFTRPLLPARSLSPPMLSSSLLRKTVRPVVVSSRAAHNSARSAAVERLLEKRPTDVVITFVKRTAIGKAKKGQLKDTPVDELLHALFKVLRSALLCFCI